MQALITGMTIAFRNLRRRRFRSILTGTMFFCGTYLLVFFVGLAEGTYDGMLTLGTRIWSGDFQIMSSDYKDKPALYKTLPFQGSLPFSDSSIQATTARVESFGLLAFESKTIGVFLNGIVPAFERKVCGFTETISQGQWWDAEPSEQQISGQDTRQSPDSSPSDPKRLTPPSEPSDEPLADSLPVVVGQHVLKRLGAQLGDELSFITQAADGSLAAELFVVQGVLSTGVSELDRNAVFIPLEAAQTLLVLEGQVHKIIGIVPERSQLQQLKENLGPQLKQWDPEAHFFPWNAIMPELEQTIKADREGLYLFLIIILVVVLLGVANTMMMSVLERQFELGLLQALGTTPLQLIWIILSEIFWLGIIGVGLGILFGVGTIWAMSDSGFPMGDYAFSYGGVVIKEMIPIITFKATVLFPFYILICGLLSGLVPALKAARQLPAQALGRTL